MTNKKPTEESKELALQEEQDLLKPERDTKFAHEAARFLVQIIKQNNWSKKLGGQSEHVQYEGWQTAGKYYGYTVKTHDAEPIEIDGIKGFKAKATVINESTGIEIGSAEAYCMRDEPNWRMKPTFQLASMAQTRSGSKALRQILGFVLALGGFNPTPAEEMDTEVRPENTKTKGFKATAKQIMYIRRELKRTGHSEEELAKKYGDITTLSINDASKIINNLSELPEVIDMDEIDEDLSSK